MRAQIEIPKGYKPVGIGWTVGFNDDTEYCLNSYKDGLAVNLVWEKWKRGHLRIIRKGEIFIRKVRK